MKNKTSKPTRSEFNILRQICNFIPGQTVAQIARETGVEEQARTFRPWSHVVALLAAQLTHSIGLNDVCDSLQLHSGPLSTIRGATPPSRNGFSNANRERSAEMAERLFWSVLEHLKTQSPGFAAGRRRGPAFRFKVPIHIVDTTVMELVANSMDWAKHRRRKAAAKTHMRLNLQSLLPQCVIVDTAAEHDNKRAREVCAGLQSGEIALFDKGFVDFGHLRDLDLRGISWVTRAKENMVYEVMKNMPPSKDPKILRDEAIILSHANKPAPDLMRRVVALVEVDGQEREMTFLTNNLAWSLSSTKLNTMNKAKKSKLFEEVKSWLEAEELSFIGDAEEGSLQVRMNLENGLVQVRLLCEESPATLQVMTAFPVKVPKDKMSAAGLLLHNVNLGLRIGAYQLLLDERLITLRLTFPIRSECDLRKQFGEAFGTALSTMDDHYKALGLFCCSTEQAQVALNKLSPGEELLCNSSRVSVGRLELN